MKLRQREDALARGIDLIEWTFDPLEIKNAFFNIERLGAIVRRYVENQYGTTSSPCTAVCPPTAASPNGGSRVARVEAILAGRPFERTAGGRAHCDPVRHREHSRARSRARAREIQQNACEQLPAPRSSAGSR